MCHLGQGFLHSVIHSLRRRSFLHPVCFCSFPRRMTCYRFVSRLIPQPIFDILVSYVYDDHARSRFSSTNTPAGHPSPERSPVILLLICISIVAHPSTLVSVYGLWRVCVERLIALQLEYPSALRGAKEARDNHPLNNLGRWGGCMKNTVCGVPGCVIMKIDPVEIGRLSKCQMIHAASLYFHERSFLARSRRVGGEYQSKISQLPRCMN